jgi:hypothetical protein
VTKENTQVRIGEEEKGKATARSIHDVHGTTTCKSLQGHQLQHREGGLGPNDWHHRLCEPKDGGNRLQTTTKVIGK